MAYERKGWRGTNHRHPQDHRHRPCLAHNRNRIRFGINNKPWSFRGLDAGFHAGGREKWAQRRHHFHLWHEQVLSVDEVARASHRLACSWTQTERCCSPIPVRRIPTDDLSCNNAGIDPRMATCCRDQCSLRRRRRPSLPPLVASSARARHGSLNRAVARRSRWEPGLVRYFLRPQLPSFGIASSSSPASQPKRMNPQTVWARSRDRQGPIGFVNCRCDCTAPFRLSRYCSNGSAALNAPCGFCAPPVTMLTSQSAALRNSRSAVVSLRLSQGRTLEGAAPSRSEF